LAEGVNFVVIVQLPPATTDDPQLFVCEKFEAFAPVMVMLDMVSTPVPVFCRVVISGALVTPVAVLGKVREVGLRLTAELPVPVPNRDTVCGELGAVSVKNMVELKEPVVDGVKVTLTTHDAAAPSEAPQVFEDIANREALAPLIAIFDMEKLAFPVLVKVTECGLDVVPTA
jgi:hypothetical protein